MKKKVKVLIGAGAACVLLLLASTGYAVAFNESRLVVPMDFSTYEFTPKDLPMIVSVALLVLYVFILIGILSVSDRKRNVTRKLNPKLGFLGFLGFLGSWTDPAMFLRFIFFGFFGFFFEGRMSDTLMDERYVENQRRAQLNAHRTAVNLIFAALLLFGSGIVGGMKYSLNAFVIVVTLAIALDLFLGEYLLYRYDHEGKDLES